MALAIIESGLPKEVGSVIAVDGCFLVDSVMLADIVKGA